MVSLKGQASTGSSSFATRCVLQNAVTARADTAEISAALETL
jgi:hypothetical protein